ncbi:MAG: hypothetical protein MZW92_06265 [Comamonadaceae bacterium]|nr:hypothetical protein [Comamonadaceae bacterium]
MHSHTDIQTFPERTPHPGSGMRDSRHDGHRARQDPAASDLFLHVRPDAAAQERAAQHRQRPATRQQPFRGRHRSGHGLQPRRQHGARGALGRRTAWRW